MDVKERIIVEATKMFSEEGIKSVRMDDIATKCGISKRTLYEIFTDREELIVSSLRYRLEDYSASVNEKVKDVDNILEEFWVVFGQGAEFRSTNMKLMKDLKKFYPAIFEDFITKQHSKIIEKHIERFRKGVEEGVILQDIDIEFTARNFTTYLYGLNHTFLNYDFTPTDNNTTPQSLRFSIMLFFRGITTEKGRKYIDEKILQGIK